MNCEEMRYESVLREAYGRDGYLRFEAHRRWEVYQEAHDIWVECYKRLSRLRRHYGPHSYDEADGDLRGLYAREAASRYEAHDLYDDYQAAYDRWLHHSAWVKRLRTSRQHYSHRDGGDDGDDDRRHKMDYGDTQHHHHHEPAAHQDQHVYRPEQHRQKAKAEESLMEDQPVMPREQPVVQQTVQPVVQQPWEQQPVVQQTVQEQPVVQQPVVQETVTELVPSESAPEPSLTDTQQQQQEQEVVGEVLPTPQNYVDFGGRCFVMMDNDLESTCSSSWENLESSPPQTHTAGGDDAQVDLPSQYESSYEDDEAQTSSTQYQSYETEHHTLSSFLAMV